MAKYERTSVQYLSADGVNKIHAWVYTPTATNSRVPAIILAHGFGGSKVHGLQPFAEAFASMGVLAIVFDYRSFGLSDGMPRNTIRVSAQQADYVTTLDYAKKLPNVDPTKLIIWGTSFAGGHALSVASTYPGLAGCISQVPIIKGRSSVFKTSKRSAIMLTPILVYDALSRMLPFLPPAYVPTVADRGSWGLLTTNDAVEGYSRFEPFVDAEPAYVQAAEAKGKSTKELVLRPSNALDTFFYNSVAKSAKTIKCPVLCLIAHEDTMCPPHLAVDAAKQIRDVEIVRIDGGHFGPYSGQPGWERTIDAEKQFVKRVVAHSSKI
ncbi:uncharacterized protein L969DRAFT_88226 [Mixia osmundae IAM 14324]|uniref:Serine aminopeptidase S33 domain-containing protein n=1 Tax=Mixia osmundae (strain CBS 9802 / IAM 14324 / JCM 22182 / KY 12970) TaxID=764103 RepID=G7E0X9_MIXOS|nr:uncharacterized protein L969DRAFT_88226 [Mixia osmundae IAM 14324]KEI38877.1 hypothetical protein L969DRAFT_88226 [Mixia osmundae IAM 14324]GAA96489.1 hypothetical protein E5Q_03157 [Mixia osmundae IAM 14324]